MAAAVAACAVVLAAAASGCETEEIPSFGDGSCVAGGCLGSSSSGTVSCTVNDACAVSFAGDIYTPILLGPSNCSSSSCHAPGAGAGDLTISITSPAEARAALLAYELSDPMNGGPYIVPCSPEGSRLLCNLKVEDGSTNEYGECGTLMPFGAGVAPLTLQQLDTIAEWITCGAPDN